MRYLFIAVGCALFTPSFASAQGCQRTSAYADEDLEDVSAIFYDPEYVEDRGGVVQLLASSDTAYVVRDESTCQAVLSQVVSYLQQNHPVWMQGQEGDFEATLYRIGPYYAVEVVPEEKSAADSGDLSSLIKHGRSATLLIYRASDLTLLRLLA